MSDLPTLFADLARLALELDVRNLRATIADGRDDGLRAASFEGAGGRSADVSSHPERMAMTPRRDRTDHDLALLADLERTYVRAIAEIAVRSRSGRPCEDWDEAVHDHQLLAEMDAVGVLERIPGEKPSVHVHRAGDALHDIERLAQRHQSGRTPTEDERYWQDGRGDNDVCAWHLEIHTRYRRPRVAGTNVCTDCLALADILGQKPRRWLLEAMIDHGDRPIAWRASLSRALDELGIVQDRSA